MRLQTYLSGSRAILKRSRIRGLFREGRRILQEEGFLTLCKCVLFSHSTVPLWENVLNGPIVACNVDNLALRIITCLEEFDELLTEGLDLSWYEMSLQQCKERLGKEAILFCALLNRDVAHISWVGTTRKSHGDFYCYPIDYGHEASVGGTMTSPKYRGKGIYTYTYSQIFQYLREKGYSKSVFEIDKDNIAVQKAQAKLGSKILGEGHHIRLLLLNFRWVRPYIA